MDDGNHKLFTKKDMNELNLQEHTYCQVLKGTKKMDCDTEIVPDSTVMVEESGLVVENTENNTNTKDNIKVIKTNQSNTGDGYVSKIIYAESKKNDKNICKNAKDLSCGINKESGSAENPELKNNTVNWPSITHNFGKRKSHKSYMISWASQISCDGFAKCLIETCNFISLDLHTMQEHYKTCDGVANHDFNVCNSCHSWLPSENELIVHESKCRNRRESILKTSYKRRNSDDNETDMSKTKDENSMNWTSPYSVSCRSLNVENNIQMSTKGVKHCDECDQEFLSDTDYSQHLICKKTSFERPSVIKRGREVITSVANIIQENTNYENEDKAIVQARWHIPKGEYVRRRAYTKQHKTAWETAIEKHKYVKCIFQNCHFLALSVEDMIAHYGFCSGDGSFAKFLCHFCGGRLTSKNFLEIHIRRSHAFEQDQNGFNDMKSANEDSCMTRMSEKKGSSGDNQMRLEELEVQFSEATPLEVEVREESISSDCEGNTFLNNSVNEEQVIQSDDQQQNIKSDNDIPAEARESSCDCSHDSTSPRNIRYSSVEDLNLLKEHNPESFAVDASQSNIQKIQCHSKSRDFKDDHIYSKKQIRSKDSESEDSLSVMKNENSKHYLGRKHLNEDAGHLKGEETLFESERSNKNENEDESSPYKTVCGLDKKGKIVRRIIKTTFPASQSLVKREVHSSYTSSWTESIKTNGFARCLVATCNFISLDIFHMENHFKNCNGEPEKGPNLCSFCNSRLPSSIELWIHTSMCKANGELNASSSDITQLSDESKNDVSQFASIIGDNSSSAEMENQRELHENENKMQEGSDLFKTSKDIIGMEVSPRKEKINSLHISDIMKLKDNGTMDYNRIIQPGPTMPKGHYVRRRSYTKTHKAVWEAALEKHKYVKCIFQNCHFLAMSLEDMIYHFGYCIGDGSFAKYECPHCGGRLTSQIVLDIHIQISHPDKTSDETHQDILKSYTEGEEVLRNTSDDWKKLIAKKQLKTYSKNTARSKKIQLQTEEAVTTEHPPETRLEDCSSCNAPALQEAKHQIQTTPEVEVEVEVQMDNNSNVNNFILDSESDEVVSSTSSQIPTSYNVDNTSLELETPQAEKQCDEILSSKKDEEKTQADTVYVTVENKSDDLVEISDKNVTCKYRSDDKIRTTKNICKKIKKSDIIQDKIDTNTSKNPNDVDKLSDANTNTSLLVLKNYSNIQEQETENDKISVSEETKEEKEDSNKNEQKTKTGRKRGATSVLLGEEDLSEKEHAKKVLDTSNTGGTSCEVTDSEGSQIPQAKVAKIEPLQSQINPDETPQPVIRKRGRPPKRTLVNNEESIEQVNDVGKAPEEVKKGRRGRKKKSEIVENENESVDYVKCAKCGLDVKKKHFNDHNYKKHVGLSWIEGENPIDLNDEAVVSWNIKQAFKHVKSATCGNCGSVKKSALGFISHIQNCGKSQEEKDALKVKCPHCPSRILKYSLPMHLKLSHSGFEVYKTPQGNIVMEEQPSKRKSAIRAANKFNEVLKQENEEEDTKKKLPFVFYEKGVSKVPKLPFKIRGLWNKMVKEGKKLPCRRGSCLIESSTIQEAKNHHFLCSELPHKSYVCQACDYYSESKTDIQQHVDIHTKGDGDFILESDEERCNERSEDETEMKDVEDEENDLGPNKSKISSSDDYTLEASYKTKFFTRERLLNERQTRYCKRSLRMTLESEMEEVKNRSSFFHELHTKPTDWFPIDQKTASQHFPILEESMSFCVTNKNTKNECEWKKVKRFMGDIVEDSAVIFAGGSVLSMAWCKYSCIRSYEGNVKQYLAVSTTKDMEKFRNIHNRPKDTPCVIQIYNCGVMEKLSGVEEVPEMAMGILHDYGEVWDLAWFPIDTYEDCGSETFLTRIGILGAACQDGTIKIWPICDPDELEPVYSLPMYKANPKVVLELEDKSTAGCLRLAIGDKGIIAGGFGNGIVAVWSLKSISLPFCKTDGKSFILKPFISFQAHKTSITALSMCQNSNRYITTSGLDRYIKFWDLECPENPYESVQKEVCLDNVWPKHWPLTISTFEDIVPCSGKGMIKAIRDVYCDKHRTPLALEGTCWSISFNEWLNILCGCNNHGEVKIRFMRNMFLADEKFRLRTGNIICMTKLKFLKENEMEKVEEDEEPCKGKNKKNAKKAVDEFPVPTNYDEAVQYFGLIFHDFAIEDDSKQRNISFNFGKRDGLSIEEYPVTSVTKVCWNPNYKRFMNLAIGHHSGIIRIRSLNDSKCNEEVLQFLNESKNEISQLLKE